MPSFVVPAQIERVLRLERLDIAVVVQAGVNMAAIELDVVDGASVEPLPSSVKFVRARIITGSSVR